MDPNNINEEEIEDYSELTETDGTDLTTTGTDSSISKRYTERKKEFNSKLKAITEQFKFIFKAQKAFYESKGKPVTNVRQNGVMKEWNRAELKKKIVSDYKEHIINLGSLKPFMVKTRKSPGDPTILLLKTNIVSFFEDWLKTEPKYKSEQGIEFSLKFAEFSALMSGWTTNSTILSLFSLYARLNNLKYELDASHMKADDRIRKHFAEVFSELEKRGDHMDKKNKKLYVKQTLDKFRITAFKTIVLSETRKDKEDLEKKKEEKAKMMPELLKENTLVKTMLAAMKSKKKPEKKSEATKGEDEDDFEEIDDMTE